MKGPLQIEEMDLDVDNKDVVNVLEMVKARKKARMEK